MKVLPFDVRVKVASALVEGVSMRSAERLTGAARRTIGALLLTLGDGCALVHDVKMKELICDVMECDEIWGFVGKKQGHLRDNDPEEFGDAYTFVALDATSRAVVSHLTDKRSAEATRVFARDVRARVIGKPQITTDGFKDYVPAIEEAFGSHVRYAQILKTYRGMETDDAPQDEMRYSGRRVVRSVKRPVIGTPDEEKISTSYVERSNLTTRMWLRRLTRLTTCFSRRLTFLRAAVSLHFAAYNFARVHSSLRITPAMQLGVTDHVWSMEELVDEALRAYDDAPPPCAPPTSTATMTPTVRARAVRPSTTTATAPARTTPVATDDYRWMW